MEIGTDENPQHWHEEIGDDVGNRLNWLRAGVLGANDGIVSTAGIVMGVAGATSTSADMFMTDLPGGSVIPPAAVADERNREIR